MPAETSALIRPLRAGEHDACERILRALPDWFGIESAIVEYVADLQAMETWVAEVAGTPSGFLCLKAHSAFAAEIHVMAVSEEWHGLGHGRRLVEHAEAALRTRAVEFLQVKTLAASHASVHYAGTRAFYERLGFLPLEENRLWGDANPCLVMVKHLRCLGADR